MRGYFIELSFGRAEMRRLSPGDFEVIFDIALAVVEGAANRELLTGVPFNLGSSASLAVTLLGGVRVAKAQIREFVLSLLTAEDRARLTFVDIGKLIGSAPYHPDVTAFLDSIRPAMESQLAEMLKSKLDEIQGATSPESST